MGLIPGSGTSPGVGNGNPLQYSCLENPMDRGAQQATVHRVAESDMTEATQHIDQKTVAQQRTGHPNFSASTARQSQDSEKGEKA